MKNILSIAFILISLSGWAQVRPATFQPVPGKQDFKDSVKISKSITVPATTRLNGAVPFQQMLDSINAGINRALLGTENYVTGTPWTSVGYLTSITSGQVTGALGFTPLATRSFGTAANNNTGDFTPAAHAGATGSAHGPVTASVNGFMIASDKSKLDGVATSAINKSQADGYYPAKGDTVSLLNYISGVNGQLAKFRGDSAVVASSLTESSIDSLRSDPSIRALNTLGAGIKMMPLFSRLAVGSVSVALGDGGTAFISTCVLETSQTLTGIKFILTVRGVFTASNFSGFAVYKLGTNGTTATRVAITNDCAADFVGTPSILHTVPLTSTYNATRGIYYVLCVYNSSATTTSPSIQATASINTDVSHNLIPGKPLFFNILSVTTPPLTFEVNTMTGIGSVPNLLIY